MKIIGIVGSARKGGNTEILTKIALEAAEAEGAETELITLSGKEIKPCDACLACRQLGKCRIEDDLPPIFEKMLAADGIILATPVYLGSASSQMKALIDRSAYPFILRSDCRPFENKVGGPLVVAGRAGQNFTHAQLMFFFMVTGMIVPGSTAWTIAFGMKKGEVTQDEEGVRTAKNFGKKLAWLAKKIAD